MSSVRFVFFVVGIGLAVVIAARANDSSFSTEGPSVDVVADSTQAGLLAEDCSYGEVLWGRSLDIEFCARICSTDADCNDGEGCRHFDTNENESGPTAGLCDPFWDVDGSLTSVTEL